MARLRDSRDDFIALIAAASEATGLPLEFVEKDYWVTEVLRAVSAPVRDGHVVFKGGTSLSKAYGLIRRFSEDVDILGAGALSALRSKDFDLAALVDAVREVSHGYGGGAPLTRRAWMESDAEAIPPIESLDSMWMPSRKVPLPTEAHRA